VTNKQHAVNVLLLTFFTAGGNAMLPAFLFGYGVFSIVSS